MPKVTINEQEIDVPEGITLIQACELAGIEIPRFCYHDRLSVAGNCRMCLVEVERAPKPVASCAMPVNEGMVVRTDSEMVKKAREGVMEFLLINHPLDCPICDQGGECDLQDQAMAYGRGKNRYTENKRAVKDKYMGPLIKTHMTRCIHCTRCVRFATEVAGVEELGLIGRGERAEITTYVEKAVTSELSGNMIDLCPVGALTSKPYAFTSRPWELTKTKSIDVMDAVGSHIRVDSRDKQVMRIQPRMNEAINEEWISDKSRFVFDGLRLQRLDRPMIRKKGKLVDASWEEALSLVADKLAHTAGEKMAMLAGDLVDAESLFVAKKLLDKQGCPNMDANHHAMFYDRSKRSNYLFNTSIAGIEDADLCLLVGADPRHEASMVGARLRKTVLHNNVHVASIGELPDQTYPVDVIADSPTVLTDIESGKHPFAERLKSAKKPMIIIGEAILKRDDADNVLSVLTSICKKYDVVTTEWNGWNILHRGASRVAALDLGFVPGAGGKHVESILEAASSGDIEVVYLLGADEIHTKRLGGAFVIYQGHHGDRGAHRADVILPGATYTEKSGTYVNLEGRTQRTSQAIFPPGQAWEDWKILATLSGMLGHPVMAQTTKELQAELSHHLSPLGALVQNQEWSGVSISGSLLDQTCPPLAINFYQSNAICRASKTMAACRAEKLNQEEAA